MEVGWGLQLSLGAYKGEGQLSVREKITGPHKANSELGEYRGGVQLPHQKCDPPSNRPPPIIGLLAPTLQRKGGGCSTSLPTGAHT